MFITHVKESKGGVFVLCVWQSVYEMGEIVGASKGERAWAKGCVVCQHKSFLVVGKRETESKNHALIRLVGQFLETKSK